MSWRASLLPRGIPPVAFANVVRNELRLARRYPRGLVFGLGLPIVLLVIFGEIPKFQVHRARLGGLSLFESYVPILISMVITLLALNNLSIPLATYREQGILRRLSTTPVPPLWVLAAQIIVNLCLAVLAIFVIVVVGGAAFAEQTPKSVGGLVLAIVMTVAALFSLGLVIAARARTAGAASAAAAALFIPLLFFAGLWVPRADMSAGLRDVSDYTPLGAAVQATQDAFQGTFPPASALLTLAGYAVVFGVLATRTFTWE